jgi:hypothetical protein
MTTIATLQTAFFVICGRPEWKNPAGRLLMGGKDIKSDLEEHHIQKALKVHWASTSLCARASACKSCLQTCTHTKAMKRQTLHDTIVFVTTSICCSTKKHAFFHQNNTSVVTPPAEGKEGQEVERIPCGGSGGGGEGGDGGEGTPGSKIVGLSGTEDGGEQPTAATIEGADALAGAGADTHSFEGTDADTMADEGASDDTFSFDEFGRFMAALAEQWVADAEYPSGVGSLRPYQVRAECCS